MGTAYDLCRIFVTAIVCAHWRIREVSANGEDWQKPVFRMNSSPLVTRQSDCHRMPEELQLCHGLGYNK